MKNDVTLTPDDLDKVEINPTNEYHILRHYSYVDAPYIKTLIGKKYWFYDYSQKKVHPIVNF